MTTLNTFQRCYTYMFQRWRKRQSKCISTVGFWDMRDLRCSQLLPPDTKKEMRLCVKGCWTSGNLKGSTSQKANNNCPRPFSFSPETLVFSLLLYLSCIFSTIYNSTILSQHAIKKDHHIQRESNLDTLDLKNFIQRKIYIYISVLFRKYPVM